LKILHIDEMLSCRDQLVEELHAVYAGAPGTNYKACTEAQKSLKTLEDMAFSDDEIDKFLPKKLRKTNSSAS